MVSEPPQDHTHTQAKNNTHTSINTHTLKQILKSTLHIATLAQIIQIYVRINIGFNTRCSVRNTLSLKLKYAKNWRHDEYVIMSAKEEEKADWEKDRAGEIQWNVGMFRGILIRFKWKMKKLCSVSCETTHYIIASVDNPQSRTSIRDHRLF